MYFPQVLNWFDEIGSKITAEFLERWPSLGKLQRARPATIDNLSSVLQQAPIAPTNSVQAGEVVFPHFAFGGGW
jgi:hypothetical protein